MAGEWTLGQMIRESIPKTEHRFGFNLTLTDDHLVIKDFPSQEVQHMNIYQADAAGMFVFDQKVRTNTFPSQTGVISPIAVQGDRIASRMERVDDKIYVFEPDETGTWMLRTTVSAEPGAAVTFGYTLAFSGTQMIVGDPANDKQGTNAGTVYLFEEQAVTVPDLFSTQEDTPIEIDVMANDAITSTTMLGAFSGFSQNGTITMGAEGAITYTPAPDFHGEETFEYALTDLFGTYTGVVTMNVDAVNDAPTALDTDVMTAFETAAPITLEGADVDGDDLTFATTAPSHGTLNGSGPTYAYTPEDGFAGRDTFTFTVNDGQVDSAPATVTVTIAPGPMEDMGGPVEMDMAPNMAPDMAPDIGMSPDAGATPDMGPGAQDSGCACTTPGTPAPAHITWLSLLGLLGLVRARARA